MPVSRNAWRTRAYALLIGIVFLAECWPFLRRLGIEVDEAMIGNAIYERAAAWYSWHIGGNEIPVMLISYLGTLKAWIYNGLFALWHPGLLSMRLPNIIVAAFTIWLFFRLLDETWGRRAAWIGAVLLASDASFILSEAIDYGPVTFQFAFKLGAMLLLLRFHRTGSERNLAAGFFLLGLALWDKSIFLWVLAGLGVATLVVYPRELRRHLRLRTLAIASGALVIGALPVILYNIDRPLDTIRSNAGFSTSEMAVKVHILKNTANGSGLFGFLTAPDSGPDPGQPHGAFQRLQFFISNALGPVTTNWIIPAFFASLASLVALRRSRRAVLFALIYLAVTWSAMAFNAGTGGAVHHAVLLWPFHLFIIAVALADASSDAGRPGLYLAIAITALLCGRNLLVMNEYQVQLIRNGGSVRWTDAFTPLVTDLEALKAPRVYVVDWGILETVNLMTEGRVSVQEVAGPVRALPAPAGAASLENLLAEPSSLFLSHTVASEQWPGFTERLNGFAASRGYQREVVRTIYDRNGRGVFELFRFRRNAG